MFSDKELKKILTSGNILTDEEFDKKLSEALKLGKKVEHYLTEKKIITPIVLYENAATLYKVPYID